MAKNVNKKGVPLLDDITGSWMKPEELAQFPSVHNFNGLLQVNKDLASVSWVVTVPFSQAYHTGAFYVNGEVLEAEAFKWYPYQAQRRSNYNGVEILSSVRMVFEKKGILFKIDLANGTDKTQELEISNDLIGCFAKYKSPLDWDWFYRLPGYPEDNGSRSVPWKAILETDEIRSNIQNNSVDTSDYETGLIDADNIVFTKNKNSKAFSAFAFATQPEGIIVNEGQGHAEWVVNLNPGENKSIEYVLSFGGNSDKVIENAKLWSKKFDKTFESSKDRWQKRFNNAFTPGNKHYSGHLPILKTEENTTYYF